MIVEKARKIRKDIIIIVDGAQYVPHISVNVKSLDIDF